MVVTYYGIKARIINIFISVKPKHWVFGADYGHSYREGSKYLLEYMIKNHPDYTCTFITQNSEVYNYLRKKSIPCEMNYSSRGIRIIAEADSVFTTQSMSDIHLAYPKKNRKFYYLLHGQSQKICQNALKDTDWWKNLHKESIFQKVKHSITNFINEGNKKSDFVAVTSDFLAPFTEMDFGHQFPVKVLGMPRNDALFDKERMSKEKWIEGVDEKFVILYMPTHRAYGVGEVTPTPFANRPEILEWMQKNNVVLLMKNHPNMIPKIKETINNECIKDITKLGLDPQVCIYHSDVLVTDFSSVWMDYLLLRRPIIFYIYDNWEQDDAGVYYDIREDAPGHFCYSEDDFFNLVKAAKEKYDEMKPSDRIVRKYHKYVDGDSCKRYFEEVSRKYNSRL